MDKLAKKHIKVSWHRTDRHPLTGSRNFDCIELFSGNRGSVVCAIEDLKKDGWEVLFFEPLARYWQSKLIKKK